MSSDPISFASGPFLRYIIHCSLITLFALPPTIESIHARATYEGERKFIEMDKLARLEAGVNYFGSLSSRIWNSHRVLFTFNLPLLISWYGRLIQEVQGTLCWRSFHSLLLLMN